MVAPSEPVEPVPSKAAVKPVAAAAITATGGACGPATETKAAIVPVNPWLSVTVN